MKYLGLLLLAQSVFSSQTEYIVELTPDPNRRLKQGTGEMDLDWVTEILNQDTKNRALSKDNERDNTILSQFNFGDKLQGFIVRTTKKTIEAIKSDPRIQYAMEDLKIEIDRISRLWTFLKSWFFSMRGAWGIDRIDQRHLPLDRKVNVSSTNQGKGITIYIIDTGINHKHHDFGGRASLGPNFVDAKPSNDSYDKKGHGTHCAGIAASNSYGVARKANIVGIKVFGKDGLAPFSALINAYSWIYNNVLIVLN